ncbi:MAG TPA: 2-oxoacid:acceptor oxidoreductase subunit alpha [Rhodospirillales bacterium]|nr:2-oxoacid:acceptor oxidoreductase subunit alpha [Rhodospirillales bacterium]
MTTTILPIPKLHPATAAREALDSVVVRFAGDSGDGIQLTGNRFAAVTALAGNDLATFPDFPAEIRAPVGTTYGVSAFQINFGARAIKTSGDSPDVLVALNPAALKVELSRLKPGGIVIVDTGSFTERNLRKAGYAADPLTDGSLADYRIIEVDVSKLTLEAAKPFGLSQHDALRCKNFWTLGLVYWMFDRDRGVTREWLQKRFADEPTVAQANIAALDAGHAFGETAELNGDLIGYSVAPAALTPGLYRTITGGEALAWGLIVGTHLASLKLFFASYPITPASPLLHALARLRHLGVTTFQAEDEIAAVCSAIGASYAGSLGVTSSSGPGVALKSEALGLAVAAELPLVVVNTQRAGPSTGMPTKTEQSDLMQALFGRHGESPVCVLAACAPSDCFDVAIEAVRIATKFMIPVIVLSDGYIANAAQPWRVPSVDTMTPFPVRFRTDPDGFEAYARDPETLARPWAIPGTPGLEHRIGGLEKDSLTGDISYDPANHQRMTDTRASKLEAIARHIPEQTVEIGPDHGRLAVVGWGSTYGPISRAVGSLVERGCDVAHIHLRHLCPMPRNLGELLRRYERVLVPEMNKGQLVTLLRAHYLVPAEGLNKVSGQPFKIEEIETAVLARLEQADR